MIKVLIICKQLESVKKIFNNIVCKIKNLHLIGIANSFSEAKKILIDEEADIIITTSKNTITFIKNNFITYNPGIIIIDSISRLEVDYPKFIIINNEKSFDEMRDKIKFFLKYSIEKSQKEKISFILNQLGFSFNWSGTIYLLDSILYAHSYKGSYSFERVKRDIYFHVANYNNTTSSRVKWSIERAIRYMYSKHSKDTYQYVEKLLRIEYPQRPVAKQIISIIANSIDLL